MKEPGGSGMVLQRAGTHRATWLQVPVTIISFQILVDVDVVTGKDISQPLLHHIFYYHVLSHLTYLIIHLIKYFIILNISFYTLSYIELPANSYLFTLETITVLSLEARHIKLSASLLCNKR